MTSRAFASLADFVTLTRTQLSAGGVWLAMKGKYPVDELTAVPADIDVFHVEQLSVPCLAAERCLVLATGRADRLSGCYIQLADDLDDLIQRADEIEAEGLYTLRIRGESATPTTPRVAGR